MSAGETSSLSNPGTSRPDPHKWRAFAVPALFAPVLPALLAVIVATQPEPPAHPWAERAASLGVAPNQITFGEVTFANACALCHGPDAEGMPKLGKPLRNSAFVQDQTDENLLALLIRGRALTDPLNTTGSVMPPRGAQALNDQQLRGVIVYLRAIQEPSAPPADISGWIVPESERTVISGPAHEMFVSYCSSCHGADANGMPDLGKSLRTSEFVASKTDEELLAFVKTGRPIWDALNTTGVDMPPKGGNPALTDDEIREIIGFIRSVNAGG